MELSENGWGGPETIHNWLHSRNEVLQFFIYIYYKISYAINRSSPI